MQIQQPTTTFVVQNGKTNDITHAWQGERVVLWDVPRDSGDKINFGAMEAMKNGQCFSGKYQSVQKIFNIPHLVVFANCVPPSDPRRGLSRGRIIPFLLSPPETVPQSERLACHEFGFL